MAKFEFFVYDENDEFDDLGVGLQITTKTKLTRIKEKQALVDLMLEKDYTRLKEMFMENMPKNYDEHNVILKAHFIKSKSTWEQGEYYAHEYDEYCAGRCRTLTLSSGLKLYEVQCLDKEKSVADGLWDYEQPISNGCGDYFNR